MCIQSWLISSMMHRTFEEESKDEGADNTVCSHCLLVRTCSLCQYGGCNHCFRVRMCMSPPTTNDGAPICVMRVRTALHVHEY